MSNILILSITFILFYSNIFAQNPAGFALSLDGDNDYADFGNAIEANFDTSDFTIEFWLNKSSTRLESVIGKREICSHSSFWNSRITSQGNIEIDQNPTAGNYINLSDTNNVADNNWHHIAYTRQGSIVRIYFNSKLGVSGNTGGTTNINNTANLLIGDSPCVGQDGTFQYSGLIDEVRLWNRCRSISELRNTMNDTLGSKYYSSSDSGLIGYWRFDVLEDLGINGDGADDVRDLSIYGNHGDLVGDAFLDTSEALISNIENKIENLDRFFLNQNYPNPFNPKTTISFYLPNRSNISLTIYDLLGREIKTLVNDFYNSGNHSVEFDATNLASGIYYYTLKAENNVSLKKMLLLR